MSKIVAIEELVDVIDGDLSWRKKELKLLKDKIPAKDSPEQRAVLRSAIPILYAHWEGFAKKSCEGYLEFVSNREIKHKELKHQFIALSLRRELNKVEIKTIEERTRAVSYLIECLEEKANIPTTNVIQTKSNLRYSVFCEIIYILGIDIKVFEKQETVINDLVDTRNTIAHGSGHKVLYQTYILMYKDIIDLMEKLRTELENAAVLENYKN